MHGAWPVSRQVGPVSVYERALALGVVSTREEFEQLARGAAQIPCKSVGDVIEAIARILPPPDFEGFRRAVEEYEAASMGVVE